MKPDRERLAMVYSAGAKIPVREGHCFWVVAGVKGAKCFADVTGDRVGKTEWKDTEGVVKNVQIVERHSQLQNTLSCQLLMHNSNRCSCSRCSDRQKRSNGIRIAKIKL